METSPRFMATWLFMLLLYIAPVNFIPTIVEKLRLIKNARRNSARRNSARRNSARRNSTNSRWIEVEFTIETEDEPGQGRGTGEE